jgi:hypothetical protein
MPELLERRILVLGSGPHPGVTSYNWSEVPVGLSVADYDVLILNLSVFEESGTEPLVDTQCLPKREQIARLLFSPHAEMIVLGSPDLVLQNSRGGEFRVDWWLPFYLEVTQEFGNTIKVIDPKFSFYFAQVSKWSAFVRTKFQPSIDPGEYARSAVQEARNIKSEFSSLAETRFNEAVAFSISMDAWSNNGTFLEQAGPIFWLPRADRITAYEAAELILKVRYHILVESEAPEWADAFTLPREDEVRTEITHISEQISKLEDSLADAHVRLKQESRFRALLFERGDALEPLVHDAFRELGATVDECPKDREDGRLVDPSGRRAIIEIKGRTGAAKLADVRQLHHWVGDAIADEDWDGKGILVVNAFADDPISERGEPFPTNSLRAAIRFDQCLITTTQLYTAIRAKQRGEFDVTEFWKTVFETTGVCDVPNVQNDSEG